MFARPPARLRRVALPLVLGFAMWLASAAMAQESMLEQAREKHVAGDVSAALISYRSFLAASLGQPELAPQRASAYNNVCVIENQLGDFPAALEACDGALELRRGLDDEVRTGRTLNNRGLALQYLGRYDEARKAFDEALEINTRLADLVAQSINRSNLGLVAAATGDYGTALDHHEAVEMLADAHPEAPWAARQRRISWINQGVVLEKLGAHRQALDIYLRWIDDDDGSLDRQQQATALVNMGTLYRNLGDPVRSEASYERAFEMLKQVGDVAGQANAALNLGQVRHLNLGALEAAERDYEQALALAEKSGDLLGEIQALGLLGRLLLESGREEEAASRFEAARRLATDSQVAEGRWSSLLGLAQIVHRRGDAAAALDHLEAAMADVESSRASVNDQALRGGFFSSHRQIYELAVDVLWNLHVESPEAGYARRALGVVQRAKQRELAEAIAGADFEPPTFLDRASDHPSIHGAALVYPDGLLIEYFFTEHALFAYLVGAGSSGASDIASGPATIDVHMSRIEEASAVADRTSAVWSQLAAEQAPQTTDLEWLSERLVSATGLANAIVDSPAFGRSAVRLTIAADRQLSYLPFELLPLGDRDGDASPAASASSALAIIDRAIVSHVPSSALAMDPRFWPDRRTASPRFTLIGIGLVDHEPAAESADRGLPSAPRMRLEPLPRSAEELRNAARVMPGTQRLLLGDAATPSALVDALALGGRVLHIAAHTVADGSAGGVVVLSSDGHDDGLLSPERIARLEANVDLTILAACRSALGDGQGVGALSSLTGAFLAAGSDTVLATLWDVGDGTSATVMAQLYPQLARGRSPAVALTEVKRRLRADKRWRAPHLWAGWVHYGATSRPVVSRASVWRPVLLATVLFLSVALAAWLIGRRRARRDS